MSAALADLMNQSGTQLKTTANTSVWKKSRPRLIRTTSETFGCRFHRAIAKIMHASKVNREGSCSAKALNKSNSLLEASMQLESVKIPFALVTGVVSLTHHLLTS